MSDYRKLTRQDLRGFNTEATDMILAAMEAGAVARISSKGHCIVRATNGMTMSVTPNPQLANRSSQNQKSEFRRVFGMDVSDMIEQQKESKPVAKPEEPKAPDVERPTLECPAKGCDKTFVTEGARYSHIDKEHYKCLEPGCGHVSPTSSGARMHQRLAHEGWKPRAGTGKSAKKIKDAPAPKKAPAKKASPKPGFRVEPERQIEPVGVPPVDEVLRTLQRVRDALGTDPRVQELQAENKALREQLQQAQERADEMQAKLELLKEALEV